MNRIVLLLACGLMLQGPALARDPNRWIQFVRFAGVGKIVLCGHEEGWVSVWDGPKQLRLTRAHQDWVHGVAYRANHVISWSRDDTVSVSTLGGTELHHWKAPEGFDITLGEVSPDGHSFVSASNGQPGLLWNLDTGQTIKLDTKAKYTSESGFAFSPDSKQVNWGVNNGVIVYDRSSGKRLNKLSLHDTFVGMAFLPDGNLSAVNAYSVEKWQIPDGKKLQDDNSSKGFHIDFRPSPSGKSLLVVNPANHEARSSVFYEGKYIGEFNKRLVGFAGENAVLSLPPIEGPGELLHLPDGKVLKQFPKMAMGDGWEKIPNAFDISPDGKWVALGQPTYRFLPLLP